MIVRTRIEDDPSGIWHWTVTSEPMVQTGQWEQIILYSGYTTTLLGALWKAFRARRRAPLNDVERG